MARKKDQVEDVPMRKNIKFISTRNQSFSVPKVDENGNVVFKKNNQGHDIVDGNGDKFPVMLTLKFEVKEKSPSKGRISVYEWKPSDYSKYGQAQNDKILEVLLKKDTDQSVRIETEDRYDKRTNPKAYVEKQKVKELEGKLSDLEAERNDVDALQKRLDELLGK